AQGARAPAGPERRAARPLRHRGGIDEARARRRGGARAGRRTGARIEIRTGTIDGEEDGSREDSETETGRAGHIVHVEEAGAAETGAQNRWIEPDRSQAVRAHARRGDARDTGP